MCCDVFYSNLLYVSFQSDRSDLRKRTLSYTLLFRAINDLRIIFSFFKSALPANHRMTVTVKYCPRVQLATPRPMVPSNCIMRTLDYLSTCRSGCLRLVLVGNGDVDKHVLQPGSPGAGFKLRAIRASPLDWHLATSCLHTRD